jgi:hypothetical protein
MSYAQFSGILGREAGDLQRLLLPNVFIIKLLCNASEIVLQFAPMGKKWSEARGCL